MTIVADASAVVALLVEEAAGAWVADELRGERLIAPALLPFEVANVLRRLELAGDLSMAEATLAHDDLLGLPVDLVPHRHLASRAWALRHNLTAYDAAYVSLAEVFDVALITLDHRLANAPGVGCEIRLPPGSSV